MLRTRTRIVLIIAAAGVFSLVWSWWDGRRGDLSAVAAAEEVQEDLEQLRREAVACLGIRDRAELRFENLDRETRRLRARVDSFEALDSRGVPADLYEEYLSIVDAFNAATGEWERESENLRRFASGCDSLVASHNGTAMELREFLVEQGIWDGVLLP